VARCRGLPNFAVHWRQPRGERRPVRESPGVPALLRWPRRYPSMPRSRRPTHCGRGGCLHPWTLQTVLATNAMTELGDALEVLAATHDSPESCLRSGLLALIGIGRTRPHLYRLMFTTPAGDPAAAVRAAERTQSLFLELVGRITGRWRAQRYGALLLTTAHGITGLDLSGHMDWTSGIPPPKNSSTPSFRCCQSRLNATHLAGRAAAWRTPPRPHRHPPRRWWRPVEQQPRDQGADRAALNELRADQGAPVRLGDDVVAGAVSAPRQPQRR